MAPADPTPSEAPAGTAAAGAAPAAAPEPRKIAGRIRGIVTDQAKRPLVGLLVALSSPAEPGVLRVTGTNDKGQYLFQELPPGVYDLRVQAYGYDDSWKERVEVKPPFQNIVDLLLKPETAPDAASSGASAAGGAAGAAGNAGAAAAGGAGSAGAAPVSTESAPPVTVRGRLVDQDRKPLVEVSIIFSALDTERLYQAFSTTGGSFEVPGILPGRYRVIVRSPGHVPLDLRSVEILKDNGLSVSLMLVDYPLNFRPGPESMVPPEKPKALPSPATTPAATQTPAPPSPSGR